jgi:hypothetical protein
VGPLAEKYTSMTGYHYALNNPVRFLDMFGMDSSDPNTVRKEKQANREARKAETDAAIGERQAADYQKEGDIRTYLGAGTQAIAASDTEGEGCGCPNPPCKTEKNNWYINATVAAQTKGPHRDVSYLYNFADKTPGYWLDAVSLMFGVEAIAEGVLLVGIRREVFYRDMSLSEYALLQET